MKNNNQKSIRMLLFCLAFCFSALAADKISQIIQGNNYKSLKDAFDKEINQSIEHLNKAKELENKYPKDSRPTKNRKAWEEHISLCEDQFFTVLKNIFKPDIKTTIQASTVTELKAEYRKRTEIIDNRLNILSELRKKYPSYDTSQLVSELNSLREQFKGVQYSCPQHQSICKNCISTPESCKACNGKGKWGHLDWDCKLCKGSGKVYAPGRTYCPKCHGRWDEGRNCKSCDHGLIGCPLHDVNKTTCPNCRTVNGYFSGQSLEPEVDNGNK